MAEQKDKVVLAYSGGLDTSCCIKWLQDEMNLDVIANREMKLSDGVEIFNAFLESKSNKIIVDCQH